MSESKIEIGATSVSDNVFKKSDGDFSNTFKAERRAYAIFRATGKGVCGKGTAGTHQIESLQVSTSNYESIIGGTRKVPKPSLTSVDWSTDGANDVIDAYLWKATVSFTCYSAEDFGELDDSFFRHLNEVELTLGWINSGNPVTVYGNIVDYQFSINEKLHYDCSVTFAGAHIQSAAAFNTAAKKSGTQKIKYGQTKSKDSPLTGELGTFEPRSIVGILRAQAEEVSFSFSEAFDAFVGSGAAGGDKNFAKAKITIPDTSWVTYIPFVDDVQQVLFTYVSLTKLIESINENVKNDEENFEGFTLYIPKDSVDKLKHVLCKSANPTSLLNGWSAKYSSELDLSPNAEDFFIGLSELEKIEEEIRRDKSDTPHLTKKSMLHFLKKVCGVINENLGNAVQMEVIPYNQAGNPKNKKYGYEITDRKTVIKAKVAQHTVANPLDLGSLIRSISVQSTTDSQMAAIALSAAQGGEDSSTIIKGGLFGCGAAAAQKAENESPPEEQLAEMFAAYSVFDSAVVSDTLVVMKKVWGGNPGTINGYSYGVTVTVTVDGYADHLFGQTFKVAGLPKMLMKDNVYFVVLKQGHKFSNGDWTMDLEGQMMFDVVEPTSPNSPAIKAGVKFNPPPPSGNTGNIAGKPGDFTTSPKGSQIRTPCGSAGVNSPFSMNRWGRIHYGYDYACPQGTPLYSPFRCKVVIAAPAASACGGMVSLHCRDDAGNPNYALVQCHLQDVYVKAGETINRGKMYGRSGGGQSGPSRGRSGGPHLHLEIYKAPFPGFETSAASGRPSSEKISYVVTDHSLMNGWNFGIGAPNLAAGNPPVTAKNTAPNLDFVQFRR